MIKKLLKWTGIVLGSLLVLLLVSYAAISHNIGNRMEKHYDFPVEFIALSADSASLARGRHLVTIKGCDECHGAGLAGKTMVDDPALGRVSASNLTTGRGGLPAAYSAEDWMMALRHGIGREGRALLFMPSHETAVLSEADLKAIIAYCRQVPPADNRLPGNKVGPLGRVLTFAGKLPLLPVEMIDHQAPLVRTVDTNEGIALGKYLAVSCSGCHRPDMKGGDALVPGGKAIPNITATGRPGHWTKAQFLQALRSGTTPEGHRLDNSEMPWKMTARYTDKELASLYHFLQSCK